MRYTDEELFDIPKRAWKRFINITMTAERFFEWCIARLRLLIARSTKYPDWMRADYDHLRNFRLKSIRLYEHKVRK